MPSNSSSVRRARDAAALLALEALEVGANVSVVVLPLLAAAAVPLPLSAHSHPRAKLLQLVVSAGHSAARSIEAASHEAARLSASLDAGGAAPSSVASVEQQRGGLPGLAADGPFRAFMGLKLQAVEGSQVSAGLQAGAWRAAAAPPLPTPPPGRARPRALTQWPLTRAPHTPPNPTSTPTPTPSHTAGGCCAQGRGSALLRLHCPRGSSARPARHGGAPQAARRSSSQPLPSLPQRCHPALCQRPQAHAQPGRCPRPQRRQGLPAGPGCRLPGPGSCSCCCCSLQRRGHCHAHAQRPHSCLHGQQLHWGGQPGGLDWGAEGAHWRWPAARPQC